MYLSEVLAWVAGIIGFALTSWATILASGLLFETRAKLTCLEIEQAPRRVFFRGALLVATIGSLSLALVNHPFPLLKLLGFGIFAWLLAAAAIGIAGISLLISDRIRRQQEMPVFTAQSRAAAITVAVSMVPIVGWLLFAPAVFLFGLGAGWRACVPPVREWRKGSHANDAA